MPQRSLGRLLGLTVIVLYLCFISILFIGFASYISRVTLNSSLSSGALVDESSIPVQDNMLDVVLLKIRLADSLLEEISQATAQRDSLQDEIDSLSLQEIDLNGRLINNRGEHVSLFSDVARMIRRNEDMVIWRSEFIDQWDSTYFSIDFASDERIDRLSTILSIIYYDSNHSSSAFDPGTIDTELRLMLSILARLQKEAATIRLDIDALTEDMSQKMSEVAELSSNRRT